MELKDKLQTALVVVLAAASLSAKIDAAPSYVATPLGTLGGNGGYANAINQSGEITGFSYLTNWTPPAPDPSVAVHAFVYRGGVMHDLGTLGGMDSEGTAINASGQIVGFSSLPTGQHPFIYVRGLLRDLGTLGGSDAQALAINYRAQATGGSAIAGDEFTHAFLYSDGVMTDLGTLGGLNSVGSGINAKGQVTGRADVAPSSLNCGSPNGHAFLYEHGKMLDLGTLSGGCSSLGTAINDAGQIIGQSDLNGFEGQHAFLWSDGVMQDLGTLGGYSFPIGLNYKGQVVGSSIANDGQIHAFLYTDGTMYDLNQLVIGLEGTLLSVANGINDRGQIVATGCEHTLLCQAFRLDPVSTLGP